MKKLLIVSDSFLPRWDGVARFLAEVIPKLSDKYNITVIAPNFKGKGVKFENVKIIKAPLSGRVVGDLPLAKFSKKLIRPYVEKTDIVWVQDLSTLGYTTIKIAHKLQKPLLSYIHVINWEIVTKSIKTFPIIKKFVYWFAKSFSRRLYNKCNILMVPTSDTGYVLEKEKITAIKTVIPLGINTEKFKPSEDKKLAKQKIEINPEYKVIGYCGRLGREKNLKTLFRAFHSLKNKFPKTKLLLVGKGQESEEQVFKNKPNIILTGEKDNVIPYLQAMDIFVLPSLTETTSLSTLEAMACGLPVIVTPLEAMKKYVLDKENGFFFPKENWLVLRKKIEMLLQKPHLRHSIGQEARKTVKHHYSWDLTVKKIEDVLERY